MGRPVTPVDVRLHMMYLKFQWGLFYEEVEQEVRERLAWRRFCQLPPVGSVPGSTTLILLNQKFGDKLITDRNKKLVKHLYLGIFKVKIPALEMSRGGRERKQPGTSPMPGSITEFQEVGAALRFLLANEKTIPPPQSPIVPKDIQMLR